MSISCRYNASGFVLLAALVLLSFGLAGCGITSPFASSSSQPESVMLGGINGQAMGGNVPIAGGNVILWETDPATSGYGVTAHNIESTTTSNPGGTFSLASGYSCTNANDYLYITITGGDVSNGSGIINNNEVQIAALGSCATFSGNSTTQNNAWVNVNEVSTVAAAYALGNFMSVHAGGSAGQQLVYIGASAGNSATTGSCSGTGSSMTCSAAGLAHAFQNALNLTNSVGTASALPTGLANTVLAGNSLGSIPQAEIHAIANMLSSCTTSVGGVAGDGSACGNLFTYATPSGGTAPTDELSAVMDIAKNPRHSTSSLYGLIGTTPPFAPSLTVAPYDWSVAITYTGLGNLGSTSSSWGAASGTPYYPEWVALDANDNVYILSGSANTSSTTTGVGAGATMSAMTTAGVGLWANAPTVDGVGAAASCTAGTNCNTGCYPGFVALDTNGIVWNTYAPSSSKSCGAQIIGRTAATGGSSVYYMAQTIPYNTQGQSFAIALDRYNNLCYARDTTSGQTMGQCIPYTNTASTATTGHYNQSATVANSAAQYTFNGSTGSPVGTLNNVYNLVFDQYSNLYAASYSASVAGNLWIIPNQTPGSLPTYSTTANAYPEIPLVGTPNHSGAIGFDPNFYTNGILYAAAANGAWTKLTINPAPSATTTIAAATTCSTCTTSAVTAQNSATTPSGASAPFSGMVDGAGTFMYVNNTSSGSIWYSYTSTTASSFVSDAIATCYAPAGGSTCANLTGSGTPSTSTAGVHNLAIDSTGAMWVSAETPGNVVQILGFAAPVWPQLNYGIFGAKP